jgi:hypothetical protein
MATILIAWELGAGFGHIGHLIPIAQALKKKEHRVVASLSNLSRGGPPLTAVGVEVFPCPVEGYRSPQAIFPTSTFAHVLHEVGFDREDILSSRVAAWCDLVAQVRPDLVLCDHSPTVLLALRDTGIKRAIIGTGFFCPPRSAFGEWPVPQPPSARRDLHKDAVQVLRNLNAVLGAREARPLESLRQLFDEVDANFLITVKELDHFPDRPNANYRGILRTIGGGIVEWPVSDYPRVFAYLKPFPVLSQLIDWLSRSQLSTLLFSDGVADQELRPAASGNLSVLTRPANMMQMGTECDLGITNANHGTICDLLLAGKPVLMIPLTSEQYLLAKRVETAGMGLTAAANNIDEIRVLVRRLLETASFRAAAQRFQARYAHQSLASNAGGIAETIDKLVQTR